MSSAATIGTKGVPKAARQEQIIATAVTEFAVHGYAGASMASIAARAGISKPLVYQYFGSKDGLYLTCLHRVAGELLERLELAEHRVDDSVASRIHALEAIFEALEPQREAWRLLYDSSMPVDGEIGREAERYRTSTEAIAAMGSERFLLARGNTDPADAAALSTLWMGVVDSLVTWWLDHPEQSAAEMTQRCRRLLAAVLG